MNDSEDKDSRIMLYTFFFFAKLHGVTSQNAGLLIPQSALRSLKYPGRPSGTSNGPFLLRELSRIRCFSNSEAGGNRFRFYRHGFLCSNLSHVM